MNLRRRNQKVIDEGIPPPQKKPTASKKKALDLNLKRVCITGTISGKTRAQATAELKLKYPNISMQNSVTSTTNYLITGFGVGQTKLKEAAKYNVIIIDAQEIFL